MARLNISRVLIANRGEIALRIIRTLHEIGLSVVAVYDEREAKSPYVLEADDSVCLGKGEIVDTFLNLDLIIQTAIRMNCQAIHPGYGFLSENSEFAVACEKMGIEFVGPQAKTISLLGNKEQALKMASKLGIPTIKSFSGSIPFILSAIDSSIFPCIVKASAGGGGKAMRLASSIEELPDLLQKTSNESKRYFNDSVVFVEKYLEKSRHIEVQVLGDKYGNVVHLFERDCSIQRRFQKVIEEAPARSISRKKKEELYSDALKIAKYVNYESAGTVEFLLDEIGNHYFLEMNTRIQVEHPVTEMITGVDIVKEQISIANGMILEESLRNLKISGHAIEARIYAEDPQNSFYPSSGKVQLCNLPERKDIRVDACLKSGLELEPEFDPLLGKIIAVGKDRNEAVRKLEYALSDTVIQGIKHNTKFLKAVLKNNSYLNMQLTTSFIDAELENLILESEDSKSSYELMLLTGLLLSLKSSIKQPGGLNNIGFWRIDPSLKLQLNDLKFDVILERFNEKFVSVTIGSKRWKISFLEKTDTYVLVCFEEQKWKIFYSGSQGRIHLSDGPSNFIFQRGDYLPEYNESSIQSDANTKFKKGQITAPISGKLIRINARPGKSISKGSSLFVIESMKMENEIRLPHEVFVHKVFQQAGSMVTEGDAILEIK